MSLERFLARRFIYKEADQGEASKRRLLPIVRLSATGVALGTMLILLSFFIIDGFKSEIRGKVNGFVGHLRISNPENSYDQYTLPLEISDPLVSDLRAIAEETTGQPATVERFVQSMSLIKADSAFRGVMMYGVDIDYDQAFYQGYLVAGYTPTYRVDSISREVMMPLKMAQYLHLGVGDEVTAYFTEGERFRVRKYDVVGLFDTGLEEYDQHLVVADARALQQVLGWGAEQVGGLSVHLASDHQVDQLFDAYFEYLADRNAVTGERFTMFKASELNMHLFAWLELLDANVLLILVLLIAVAGMTMITGVVVLVLERVATIAILKALGQKDRSFSRLFRYVAVSILLRGMIIGNFVALLLAGVQYFWRPISLDPKQYFVSFVPIHIDWGTLLWVNLLIFVVVFLFILIPSRMVAQVRPSVTLRFE